LSGGQTVPGVAAVILAAGRSSRMGPRNKLLLRDECGHTMIGRVVQAVIDSRVSDIVLVTGHQAASVEAAALHVAGAGSRLRVVHAPSYTDGLSASLKAGIEAVAGALAALVCLGDMPLVTGAMLDRLIGAFTPGNQKTIVVPTCGGMRGNPVLWDRKFFPAFAALSGDRGARELLAGNRTDIAEVELGETAILRDFDTPDAVSSDWADPSF